MSASEHEIQSLCEHDKSSPLINKEIVEQALEKIGFSDAAKKLLLDPNSSQASMDSVESIALTRDHLSQVKQSLAAIVDNLQENPSMISQAAKYWGELSLPKRILGGVVISGPTLLIGAAAHIGFLVSFGCASALAYTTSGIVLDDHHYHSKNINLRLRDGIFGVAEALELTISALDLIRTKLAYEVERFNAENTKLSMNIERLNAQSETLSIQIENYMETEQALRKTQEELEAKARELSADLEEQGKLFKATQNEISQVKMSHEQIQIELSNKASELDEVRCTMGAELAKAKKLSSSLESAVKTLSNVMISDSTQRQAFFQKLDDQTNTFGELTEGMMKAEKELTEVKAELKASNERYKNLLEIMEQQIRRMEGIDKRIDTSLDLLQPVVETRELMTGGLLNHIHSSVEQRFETDQDSSENKKPETGAGALSTFSFLGSPQNWLGRKKQAQPLVPESTQLTQNPVY